MVDAENEDVVGTKSVGCWVSNGQDIWITRSSYFGADDLRGVTYKKKETLEILSFAQMKWDHFCPEKLRQLHCGQHMPEKMKRTYNFDPIRRRNLDFP